MARGVHESAASYVLALRLHLGFDGIHRLSSYDIRDTEYTTSQSTKEKLSLPSGPILVVSHLSF